MAGGVRRPEEPIRSDLTQDPTHGREKEERLRPNRNFNEAQLSQSLSSDASSEEACLPSGLQRVAVNPGHSDFHGSNQQLGAGCGPSLR